MTGGPHLQKPLSDALEADCDAALRQEVFYISKAQAESVVEPKGSVSFRFPLFFCPLASKVCEQSELC